MFVKLTAIVLCALLLNLSECKNCEDVFKCAADKVAAALTPYSNSYVDNIETPTYKSMDDNLFTDLTQFIVDKFSNLFKQGPLVKHTGKNTKIYVQTFEGNYSIIASSVKPDVIEKNHSSISTHNQTFIFETQDFSNAIFKAMVKEKVTTSANIHNGDILKIETNTIDKPLTTPSDTSANNVNNNTIGQNFTYSLIDTSDELKTTTEVYLDSTYIVELKNEDDKIIGHETIQGNKINDAYDFFLGRNEIDIGDLGHDNLSDYLDVDYIDLYKDTTNEDVEYTPATYIPTTTEAVKFILDQKTDDDIDTVYPWIAAVFVMNSDSSQFEYICDGILLSERVVLTAARCVVKSNVTVDVASTLVILGKRSLQAMGLNEKVLRVKSINIHENFTSTEGKVDNDLAIIVLEERVAFNVAVKPAPLGMEDESEPLAVAVSLGCVSTRAVRGSGVTTGWHVSGPLQPLYLRVQTEENCMKTTGSTNIICFTQGDNDTTCPSFGGLLVYRQNDSQWRLKGIATGDPITKGVCFSKDLMFTRIGNYFQWITKNVLAGN